MGPEIVSESVALPMRLFPPTGLLWLALIEEEAPNLTFAQGMQFYLHINMKEIAFMIGIYLTSCKIIPSKIT